MSTVAYGALTSRRKLSNRGGKSKQDEPPGVGLWADSFTALVPGEVLVLHALVMPRFSDGYAITNPATLRLVLGALLLLCVALYLTGLYLQGERIFGGWDVLRISVVLVAFVGWMMAQKPSALDAIIPLSNNERLVPVMFLAFILPLVATYVGNKADDAPPDQFSIRNRNP